MNTKNNTAPAPAATTAEVPATTPHDAADLLAKAENLDRAARHLREAEKIRAAEKCSLGYGGEGAIDRIAERVEAAAETARRSALPIAVGDLARVKDENRRGAEGLLELGVVRVGPKRVYLQDGRWAPQAYELETGVEIGHGHRCIVEADLHRIRRDLAPKPKAPKATK
jgi:hypothetical protein